ncbi:hypothetical protein [Salinimicrobium sp. GXAS 041]|uniref:hypothetical protein n=1 Tax=Salinimicrobium sp. GXAS 041 TaxID=3400806 RepID=UPI003C7779C0
MPKIQEYKDQSGKHRIRQVADNGQISDSTHQGYFNLADAREGKINTSLNYLKHYFDEMTEEQLKQLSFLGSEADSILNQPK